MSEDTDPTKFFLLLSGHATVHRGGQHLNDLGPGDVFGEIGVLSLEPRSATVITTTGARVAVAMGWDLRDLLDKSPHLKARVESLASARHAGD